ncbi:amidohydrolase family protein [Acetobacterium paludosum]|uniref:Amidohydrolase family protein n=1 Tax=Acetobacterium paludosum TaxID=52693 RepID=A0A923KR17_9FIRM|nr:amidohydrolase family protein [Acetobacterium paludosum]MBC3886777.1 amidohydrolase family protein [Acetobacterium paludosum]
MMNKKYKIIDVQSHFLPEKWMDEVSKRNDYPMAEKITDDKWIIHGSEYDKLPYHTKKSGVDINAKLKEMDEVGIDMTILTLSPPGPDNISDGKEADRLAKISNDGISEIVSCYPDRFRGIANLGYGNMEDSIKELKRCIDELNFVGLQVYPYAKGGVGIDDVSFRPVFKILEENDIPLILHPGSPINKDYKAYMMGPLMGYWFDDAMTMMKLILSGLFEELPNLKVVCPHAWSLLPFLIDRIDIQVSRFPEFFVGNIKKAPSEYLKNVFTDCNNFSTDTLKFVINKMGGVNKMMFGSDSPFVEAKFVANLILELGLPEEDIEKIFYNNAKELFKIT